MDSNSRTLFLADIASRYYDQNQTQQEIADNVGVTRSAISRLLTEARQKGIVEIIVHHPHRSSNELEKALIEHFNLRTARVLLRQTNSMEDLLSGLGVLASQYFTNLVRDGDVVGVSWGTALSQMVRNIKPLPLPNVEVVQIVGGISTRRPSTVDTLLAPLLADLLGCTCHYLPAPAFTDNEEIRDVLIQQKSIRETLERAEQADIALLGIGSTNPEVNTPYQLGYISEQDLQDTLAADAVGNVCGWHYNIAGEILDINLNKRVIGLDPVSLSKIPQVIGVSGGGLKAEGILGALHGGYVNVLITDEHAARRMLEIESAYRRG